MGRSAIATLALCALLLAAGVKLKDLFEPDHPEWPLRPYGWEEWEQLDRDRKFESMGTDPKAWVDPPPDPPDPEEEKRKQEKEEEERKRNPTGRKEYPQDRHPGFRFDERLAKKQASFEALVQPASASMLEGLIRQLKAWEKEQSKFEKKIGETTEAYVKVKEMYDTAVQPQIDQAIKKTGKPPTQVLVNRALMEDFHAKSRALHAVLSLQQSERQFADWMLGRIATLIGELTDEERQKPVAALAKGLGDKDWSYRVRCAGLLGGLSDPAAVASFSKALAEEKDPLVLGELIRIRAKRGGEDLLALLQARLEDPDWPVRAAVIRELGKLRRKEAVDLLVARLAMEEGRLKDDIATELRRLTGQRYDAEPEPWRIWWEKWRETWTPPAEVKEEGSGEETKEGSVYFYGIKTSSKRIVFCIDVSGSMSWPLDGEKGKQPPRIETAKRELVQALTMLPEEARFNIVSYNSVVDVWKPRLVEASIKNKQAARKYVDGLGPAGATNIYDALTASLEVAASDGKGKDDNPEADTIFFMTDGQPTNGKIVDPHQILEAIASRNRLLGVVIHTIGVSKEQNAGFLLNLALQNRGRYVGHK